MSRPTVILLLIIIPAGAVLLHNLWKLLEL